MKSTFMWAMSPKLNLSLPIIQSLVFLGAGYSQQSVSYHQSGSQTINFKKIRSFDKPYANSHFITVNLNSN